MKKKKSEMLILGTIVMLFAGILYAWSILKSPFVGEFNWNMSELTLNFTLTMCFFCVGGSFGSKLINKIGSSISLIIAAVISGTGFILTGCLTGKIFYLYITYALMAGLGIGIIYNVVLSTVSAWYSDRRGFCTGVLMMGFGASSLLFGNLISVLFDSSYFGWRTTYIVLGVCLVLVISIIALFLNKPKEDEDYYESTDLMKNTNSIKCNDYTTKKMIHSFTFWRAFVCVVCLAAVGNSVISFAKDVCLEAGASSALATTLVGLLSICNGLGRVITGVVFDKYGLKVTMIFSNILNIIAPGIILFSLIYHSIPCCIIGLAIIGLAYGSCPTVASTFTSSFYGQKHFASNFSVMNFNLLVASFAAMFCSQIIISTGTYTWAVALLIALSIIALGLNLSIKKKV